MRMEDEKEEGEMEEDGGWNKRRWEKGVGNTKFKIKIVILPIFLLQYVPVQPCLPPAFPSGCGWFSDHQSWTCRMLEYRVAVAR